MKKQKIVILGSEQQNKHDLDTIHKLQEGLNQVDQSPVYTPELQWFEQMVLAEQQKTRKKLLKDLSIFLIIALFILSALIISLYQLPIFFVFLQITTTAFIAHYTITKFSKKVENR